MSKNKKGLFALIKEYLFGEEEEVSEMEQMIRRYEELAEARAERVKKTQRKTRELSSLRNRAVSSMKKSAEAVVNMEIAAEELEEAQAKLANALQSVQYMENALHNTEERLVERIEEISSRNLDDIRGMYAGNPQDDQRMAYQYIEKLRQEAWDKKNNPPVNTPPNNGGVTPTPVNPTSSVAGNAIVPPTP